MNNKKIIGIIVIAAAFIVVCGVVSAIILNTGLINSKEYGVFLDADDSDVERIMEYKTVVLDAQYFSKDSIKKLKDNGCEIYSYINVGSLEDFREYFHEYEHLILGEYENWPGEYWVDVSDSKWQQFNANLAKTLQNKGVDGFFVDNCDVYYNYKKDGIFNGLVSILKEFKKIGAKVVINGGDTFVMDYIENGGVFADIMDGINQESVYTSIDFDNETFGLAKKDDTEYYLEYIDAVTEAGGEIYTIEYVTKNVYKWRIYWRCAKKGWKVYISDSINLD